MSYVSRRFKRYLKLSYYFLRVQIQKVTKVVIIETKYDGLGDHLFYSHLPEIAKKLGYKKVLISNKNKYRNSDIMELIWRSNPYVDGFTNFGGIIIQDFADVLPSENLLDRIMLLYGLDDGIRFHDPKIYKRFSINKLFIDKVVYDPNYISHQRGINEELLNTYLNSYSIEIDYQLSFRQKNVKCHYYKDIYSTLSLDDYCSLIISCKTFYCLTSGSATLAVALGIKPFVMLGSGHKNMFHHSKRANYIEL